MSFLKVPSFLLLFKGRIRNPEAILGGPEAQKRTSPHVPQAAFTTFARKLQLPQTAVLVLNGPQAMRKKRHTHVGVSFWRVFFRTPFEKIEGLLFFWVSFRNPTQSKAPSKRTATSIPKALPDELLDHPPGFRCDRHAFGRGELIGGSSLLAVGSTCLMKRPVSPGCMTWILWIS